MSQKKRFLLRIDPDVYAALAKWAADDRRSVNAQVEFLLREALMRAGRSHTRPSNARNHAIEGGGDEASRGDDDVDDDDGVGNDERGPG